MKDLLQALDADNRLDLLPAVWKGTYIPDLAACSFTWNNNRNVCMGMVGIITYTKTKPPRNHNHECVVPDLSYEITQRDGQKKRRIGLFMLEKLLLL